MQVINVWSIDVCTDKDWINELFGRQMSNKQVRSIDVHESTFIDKALWIRHQRVKCDDSITAGLFEHFQDVWSKTGEKGFWILKMHIIALTVWKEGNKASNMGGTLFFQRIYSDQQFHNTIIDLFAFEPLN